MRYFLACGFFIFFLNLNQIERKNESLDLHVKSDEDSLNLPFFLISIFQKGYPVQDTFANQYGIYSFSNKNEIEGFIIRYSGYYPVYKTMNEVKENPVIYLLTSKILKQTNGLGIDSVLLDINDSLEVKILNWNK